MAADNLMSFHTFEILYPELQFREILLSVAVKWSIDK